MSACSSAEVVLSTLLLEEVELLEGLQSVDGKHEVGVLGHTETSHGVLELDIVEDDGSDVVGVLLGKGLIWSGLDLGNKAVSISQDGGTNLGAEISSSVVSLSLGVGDSEGHVGVDSLKISLDRCEKSSLWVLLNLGGLSSSSLMGGDVGIRNGVWSDIWKSSNVLVSVVVVVTACPVPYRYCPSGRRCRHIPQCLSN